MKKLSNFVLWAVGLAGGYLVAEGAITGEELGSIQNITGLAMSGGAVGIGTVILVIKALPKQLVAWLFNKLAEKYGQEAVDGFIGKVEDIQNTQAELKELTSEVKGLLLEAKEQRESLLNE